MLSAMASCVFLLLIGVLVAAEKHFSEFSCITKPKNACTYSVEPFVKNSLSKIPDGPLRDLPGTARNLSILIENSDEEGKPSLVITWRAPIGVSTYKIYIFTWDNDNPPTRSTPFQVYFTVNTTRPRINEIRFRVKSKTFRGSKDIIVYVNTWLMPDNPCCLRQAKATFFPMTQPKLTTRYWNYHATMDIRDNHTMIVGYQPYPNAGPLNIRVCESPTRCQDNKTTNKKLREVSFPFNQTCNKYYIKIIPMVRSRSSPVYTIERFIPALECSVAEDDCTRDGTGQCLTTDVTSSNTNVVVWSVTAGLSGLATTMTILVVRRWRSRKARTCLDKNVDHRWRAVNTEQNNDYQRGVPPLVPDDALKNFRSSLDEEPLKQVCIVYAEDAPCHCQVVRQLATCLANLRCNVSYFPLEKDPNIQLKAAHAILIVHSDVLNRIIKTRNKFEYLEHLQVEFDSRYIRDRIASIYFMYSFPNGIDDKNVFEIPANILELVDFIHNTSFGKRRQPEILRQLFETEELSRLGKCISSASDSYTEGVLNKDIRKTTSARDFKKTTCERWTNRDEFIRLNSVQNVNDRSRVVPKRCRHSSNVDTKISHNDVQQQFPNSSVLQNGVLDERSTAHSNWAPPEMMSVITTSESQELLAVTQQYESCQFPDTDLR